MKVVRLDKKAKEANQAYRNEQKPQKMRDTVPAYIPSHISPFTKLRCSLCLSSLLLTSLYVLKVGRRGDHMVSALVSGSSGPGSSPGRGHCVVFLGKTLYSHSASLHPGV